MADRIQLTKLAHCAGCGAKVGAGTLSKMLKSLPVHHDERLLVGFDTSDDCSVYQLTDDCCVIQTLDFFPPIVDDPYTFGQIAAANALSDIFAMGAEPKLAMNILCTSTKMTDMDVQALLQGGYEKVYEAGALITGGHSIMGEEPKYGLSVTGFAHPEAVLLNSKAKPGDCLILTKPLGIGILTTAAKGELVEPELYQRAVVQMCTLNKQARDIMVQYEVHACTDVTGFGLLGHAYEMAQGAKVTLAVQADAVPVLPGVRTWAEMGLLPEGMYRNRMFAEPGVHAAPGVDAALQDILYDPQTSGGLLIAVAEKQADALCRQLADTIPCACIIGQVEPQQEAFVHLS